jgi:hypothetical protein
MYNDEITSIILTCPLQLVHLAGGKALENITRSGNHRNSSHVA